ncbi:MAG: aminotransferase class V-fold PLP-dependent enzyme [Candidatus Poseidoniia archaeon]|nr:aminotransferase class V-fold PLP-dependent enzyme [Candidatus Poseidoniia archaeon]
MSAIPRRSNLGQHWNLQESTIFLNHGSFGACPHEILEHQNKLRGDLESDPVNFFDVKAKKLWAEAIEIFSDFINADKGGLVFVPNATSGVNTVLRSLDLQDSDEIIVLDHTYQACWNAVDFVTKRSGAKTVIASLPYPIESPEHVTQTILNHVTEKTKLALIDTVTSPTGIRLPFEEIVKQLQSKGIDVLLDAAHGPGIVPLDLEKLQAAYVAGNAHKWLCTPKGAAFLHIRQDKRNQIRPLSISHGASVDGNIDEKIRLEFDWTGTQDITPWLCIPKSIEFISSLVGGEWSEIMKHNTNLAIRARDILLNTLDTPKLCPDSMIVGLSAVVLPEANIPITSVLEPDPLHTLLYEKYKIQVPVFGWPHHNKRYLRTASYLYNSFEEYEYLAEVLAKEV